MSHYLIVHPTVIHLGTGLGERWCVGLCKRFGVCVTCSDTSIGLSLTILVGRLVAQERSCISPLLQSATITIVL